MTTQDIYRIAMEQSAIDAGCSVEQITADGIHTCLSPTPNPAARRYLKLPLFCDIFTYGTGMIVSARDEQIAALGKAYLEQNPYPYCFLTPTLHQLTDAFAPWNARPYHMAEYFLPDIARVPGMCGNPSLPCDYPTRILTQPDFAPLYTPAWSNALCASRKHLDVMGVAAYDGDTMIGFAACSADCDTMWQIGIDVLPAYRHRGIASALTSRLTCEILVRGKVPFYCAAWSNLGSVRNAIDCGFRPAWVHLTCVVQEEN